MIFRSWNFHLSAKFENKVTHGSQVDAGRGFWGKGGGQNSPGTRILMWDIQPNVRNVAGFVRGEKRFSLKPRQGPSWGLEWFDILRWDLSRRENPSKCGESGRFLPDFERRMVSLGEQQQRRWASRTNKWRAGSCERAADEDNCRLALKDVDDGDDVGVAAATGDAMGRCVRWARRFELARQNRSGFFPLFLSLFSQNGGTRGNRRKRMEEEPNAGRGAGGWSRWSNSHEQRITCQPAGSGHWLFPCFYLCYISHAQSSTRHKRATHAVRSPRVSRTRGQRLGRSAAHSDWDMRVEGKRSHPATPLRLPNHPANQFQSSSFPLSPCRCIVSIG